MKIKVCISSPFRKPDEGAKLVVFKNVSTIDGFVPEDYNDIFINSCIKYAKKYSVYLVTCLFKAMNCLCLALFSPEGELMGMQKATHLNLKLAEELKTYDGLDVIPTPIGKIFLCVDVDIYKPEVIRSAAFAGCDYIISSQYFEASDFNQDRILFGARSAAVANSLFIINVNNITSCVTSPEDITGNKDGFYVYPTDEETVTTEFDYDLTAEGRDRIIDRLIGNSCLAKYSHVLGK